MLHYLEGVCLSCWDKKRRGGPGFGAVEKVGCAGPCTQRGDNRKAVSVNVALGAGKEEHGMLPKPKVSWDRKVPGAPPHPLYPFS